LVFLPYETITTSNSGEKKKGDIMLSKIIVGAWSSLIEVSLWLLLIVALIGGWQASGFIGAIVGLVISFIVGSMFLGAFLVLDDIRKTVKAIEGKK
jgi:membrane protein DedA with SNARE-associated domain